MTNTSDIVAKLWNLCHVLRDDGITYHQYVTELTFLLVITSYSIHYTKLYEGKQIHQNAYIGKR